MNIFIQHVEESANLFLGHMLQGLKVDPNPMLTNPAHGKELPIIYEDPSHCSGEQANGIVNRSLEFTLPTVCKLVFRLYFLIWIVLGSFIDWICPPLDFWYWPRRKKPAHQFLQQQFANQTVEKRYTALLDGHVSSDNGQINLPLRVDLNDRPVKSCVINMGVLLVRCMKLSIEMASKHGFTSSQSQDERINYACMRRRLAWIKRTHYR